MSDDSILRSRAHPLIKRVGAIQAGREAGMLVLEGDRLIDDALGAGLALEVVLVANDRRDRAAELDGARQAVRVVDRELMQRISGLKTSPGILALCAAPRSVALVDLDLGRDALVLVVAGVADPGNLGALARSAEAFGARAIVIARGGAGPWNDKALRGSMGSLLRIPVCFGESSEDIAGAFEKRGVRQLSAATRGGADPLAFDWRGPCVLWISGETGTLPAAAKAFEALTIPMTGGVESLNVTVAAALLLFASGRSGSKSIARHHDVRNVGSSRDAEVKRDLGAKTGAVAKRDTTAKRGAEAKRDAGGEPGASARREADAKREAGTRRDAEVKHDADVKRGAEAKRGSSATRDASGVRDAGSRPDAASKKRSDRG